MTQELYSDREAVARLDERMKLADYKHKQLDRSLTKVAELQGNTQKMLNDFITVAAKHFERARIVEKIVYTVTAVAGMGITGYFLPKILEALLRAIK